MRMGMNGYERTRLWRLPVYFLPRGKEAAGF